MCPIREGDDIVQFLMVVSYSQNLNFLSIQRMEPVINLNYR